MRSRHARPVVARLSRSVVALGGLAAGFAAGCVPPTPALAPVPKPRFTYTPAEPAAPGSAKVSFALIAPEWVLPQRQQTTTTQFGETPGYSAAVQEDLTSAMRADFLALVTARGFTVRGPFASYQEMVFPDKEGSDLVLVPQVDIAVRFEDLKPGGNPLPLLGYFAVDGTATLKGTVTLLVTESLTNERMWTKNIAIPVTRVSWTGAARFPLAASSGTALKNLPEAWPALAMEDPAFQAAIGPKLEAMYRTILQTAWNYLDPREMALVRRQAAEIKKRKAY